MKENIFWSIDVGRYDLHFVQIIEINSRMWQMSIYGHDILVRFKIHFYPLILDGMKDLWFVDSNLLKYNWINFEIVTNIKINMIHQIID